MTLLKVETYQLFERLRGADADDAELAEHQLLEKAFPYLDGLQEAMKTNELDEEEVQSLGYYALTIAMKEYDPARGPFYHYLFHVYQSVIGLARKKVRKHSVCTPLTPLSLIATADARAVSTDVVESEAVGKVSLSRALRDLVPLLTDQERNMLHLTLVQKEAVSQRVLAEQGDISQPMVSSLLSSLRKKIHIVLDLDPSEWQLALSRQEGIEEEEVIAERERQATERLEAAQMTLARYRQLREEGHTSKRIAKEHNLLLADLERFHGKKGPKNEWREDLAGYLRSTGLTQEMFADLRRQDTPLLTIQQDFGITPYRFSILLDTGHIVEPSDLPVKMTVAEERIERSGITWERYLQEKEQGESDREIVDRYGIRRTDLRQFKKDHAARGEQIPEPVARKPISATA